ncbi:MULTISPECIES: pro-sigmaK processing inhibitor BofA family protein [Megasphaera]|nr:MULTISPECIES: pro-sigmaK processing inhibitor BofA family protein [Megasphaera]
MRIIMQYGWIIGGIIILFIINKIFLMPLRKLTMHIIMGIVVLYVINTYGSIIGLATVPITAVTGIIIGILGFPGTILLTLYYTFLQ